MGAAGRPQALAGFASPGVPGKNWKFASRLEEEKLSGHPNSSERLRKAKPSCLHDGCGREPDGAIAEPHQGVSRGGAKSPPSVSSSLNNRPRAGLTKEISRFSYFGSYYCLVKWKNTLKSTALLSAEDGHAE